jgi:hypothetical protein
MNNKRGAQLALETIIVGIIVLVVLGVLLYNWYKGSAGFSAGYSRLDRLREYGQCKSLGQVSSGYFDNDYGGNSGDKFPDSCDVCWGGDDRVDCDKDGIPNECDDDPASLPERKKPMAEICASKIGEWKDDKRCVLACRKDINAITCKPLQFNPCPEA